MGAPRCSTCWSRCHIRVGETGCQRDVSLLPEVDETLFLVEVPGTQCQSSAPAGRGLGVKPDDQRVELGIVAGGRDDVVELVHLLAGQRPSIAGLSPGLRNLGGGVGAFVDELVVDSVPVDAAQRGDEVFGGGQSGWP